MGEKERESFIEQGKGNERVERGPKALSPEKLNLEGGRLHRGFIESSIRKGGGKKRESICSLNGGVLYRSGKRTMKAQVPRNLRDKSTATLQTGERDYEGISPSLVREMFFVVGKPKGLHDRGRLGDRRKTLALE